MAETTNNFGFAPRANQGAQPRLGLGLRNGGVPCAYAQGNFVATDLTNTTGVQTGVSATGDLTMQTGQTGTDLTQVAQAGEVASTTTDTNTATTSTTTTASGLLPSASSMLQSGAFGALLGAATSGISNYAEYKQGKKSKEDAFADVAKNTVQGAATMVVASIATHIVRTNPLLGVAALVAGGVGSYILLQNKIKEEAQEVETSLKEAVVVETIKNS